MDYTEKQYKLAYAIAKKAHDGQFRNDGVTPYFNHPKELANQFANYGVKAVCILHDVVEDCGGYTIDTLKEFGLTEWIVHLVEVLTHRPKEPYKEYINRVIKDPLTTKIKIADMMLNLCDDPTDHQKEKYKKYIKLLINSV